SVVRDRRVRADRDRLLSHRRDGRTSRRAVDCRRGGVSLRHQGDVPTIIELTSVGKTFTSRDATTEALSDISLRIDAGEVVSIIGPSGCGKSTLLRIVGDLVEPSGGTVLVNGKSARQARLDRDYGIVFQTPVLYEWRTVLENVRLPLEVTGRPRDE